MKTSRRIGVMSVLTLGFCVVGLLPLYAKVIKNPDTNTLWIENGTDIEVGSGSSGDHRMKK